MITGTYRGIAIVAAAAALWAVAIVNGRAALAGLSASSISPRVSAACGIDPAVLRRIDLALDRAPDAHAAKPEAPAQNPFSSESPLSSAAAQAAKSGKATAPRTLVLRGILIKNVPLAIIDDETGKSWICKQGDSVATSIVVSVGNGSAKLRDRKGTFTLTVPEK